MGVLPRFHRNGAVFQEDTIHTSSPTQRTYVISVGDEQREVVGRADAVTEAKARSAGTGRVIHLERTDGVVRMDFQRGHLQSYLYEPRGPSSRS